MAKKENSLMQAAEIYRKVGIQIKALEKQRDPYKKMLIEHAEEMELDNIDLGPVSLEKRTTEKGIIGHKEAVNPDWLWRMQDNGFGDLVKVSIDPKKVDVANRELHNYLSEIGYQTKESVSYAIRLNP